MGVGEKSTGRRESVLRRMTSGYEKAGLILRTARAWICQKYRPCEKELWQVIRWTKVGQTKGGLVSPRG